MSEIWAANKALDDAKINLEQKITSITPQEGRDASTFFSQTDDRQKFEKLFSNGGFRISIDEVINLSNTLTKKGVEELDKFFSTKK